MNNKMMRNIFRECPHHLYLFEPVKKILTQYAMNFLQKVAITAVFKIHITFSSVLLSSQMVIDDKINGC